MAAPNSNLVLQLLITAKDDASAAFSKLFKYLDDNTKVISGKIREAFTGVFGGGIAGAAELEAALDRVAAKGGYTGAEVDQLKTAAQQLGAQFGISGVEAAQGMESLAAAGLKASEAIATLPQVLALASAEQISADAAATKLIDSLSIMGLGFEEAGRMADVLSKGADITTSSASQLAEALTAAGGTAKAAGMDLESTVAALDLLHKNGIKGSEAGTALKAVLTALLDPASKASTELTALGISSRDLGTVLAALQDKGGAASGAILAFGQEAGPGLRALISEGQAGLDEYTAQLKNAEGAAKASADAMGGNLKSALATLSSAWESLKTALLDPLLEPITVQVNALGAAFQEGLSSDKFKAVQATIKDFGEAAGKAISDFVMKFDFAGALASLADFVTQAKGHFEGVGKTGTIVAESLVIAWNGLTAGFKTLGAALAGIAASVLGNLAVIEEAASKVGLGSVERANELNAKALEMKNRASELLQQVATDGNEMKAAFDRLKVAANETTVAVNDLKKAAEIAPDAAALEPIKKSLADYAGLLDRAKTAQQEAAKAASASEANYLQLGLAMDNGTGSAQVYEFALKENAAAQAALKVANENLTQSSSEYTAEVQRAIRETNTESAAATAAIPTKKALYEENQRLVTVASAIADAYVKSAASAVDAAQAELQLAQAKGDSTAIAEASVKVAQAELTALQAKRIEQEKELQQYQLIAERIADLTQRKSVLGAADQAELAALQQKYPAIAEVVAGREKDIAATDAQIKVQEREKRQAELMAGPVGELIRLYEKKGETLSRETAAVERHYNAQLREIDVEIAQAEAKGDTVKVQELKIDRAEKEAEMAQAVADAKIAEIQAEIDLADAKRLALLAEGELNEANQKKLAQLDEQIAKLKDAQDAEQDKADGAKASAEAEKEVGDAAKESGDAQEKAGEQGKKATASVMANVVQLIAGYEGLTEAGLAFAESMNVTGTFYGPLAIGQYGNAVQKAKGAVLEALQAEELFNEELQKTAAIAEGTGREADKAQSRLVDMATNGRTHIQGLTQAGEQARQKLEAIKTAALEAEVALSEMAQDFNKQILQLKGDQKALLDIEQQERLAQIEDLYAQSGQLASEEYQDAKSRADELHNLKLKQLADENAKNQETTSTAADTARNAWRSVGEEIDAVSGKMKGFASQDLSGMVNQSAEIKQNFSDLQSVL